MKIAALADIHGNVFALEAVLADVKRHTVDYAVNLGDVFYGPIAPRATYELLRPQDMITVRGNEDRLIYQAGPEQIASNPTLQFVLDELGRDALDWLSSLPFDAEPADGIYLCHGTPADDMGYLLENIETGAARMRPEAQILEQISGQEAGLILCGHTHTPRCVLLGSGQLVVNPGSVGLPAYDDDEPVPHAMETFSPHACYAVLDKTPHGWTVQHIKVAYDHHLAAREAKKHYREDWTHFLTTGRRS